MLRNMRGGNGEVTNYHHIVHLHHIASVRSVGPGVIIMMSIMCKRSNTETEIIRSWCQCWSQLTTTIKMIRMSPCQPQFRESPCRGGESTPSDLQSVVR